MDIQAAKPVSGVSASVPAAARHEAIPAAAPEIPAPSAGDPPAVRPLAQDLLRTQQAIAEQVSKYLQSSARNLEFQVDGDSGNPVIVVRDGEGNVIRRIPGEEALQLMRRLNAESGTLVDSLA